MVAKSEEPVSIKPPNRCKTQCKKTKFELCTYDEAPEFLRMSNIHTGYRAYFTAGLCVQSIFRVHNQTGNVWTHLIATVLFASLLRGDLDLYSTDTPDRGIFAALLGGWIVAFACSTAFHLFNCQSEHAYNGFNVLDCLGVVFAIAGMAFSHIFYGFYCYESLQLGYCLLVALLAVVVLYVIQAPVFRRPENKMHRTLFFAAFIVICSAIILHSVILTLAHGSAESVEAHLSLFGHLGGALVFTSIGSALYATGVPERFWPGSFDIVGNSHTLWHIFVIFAGLTTHRGVCLFADWRANSPCAATLQ